MKEKIEETLSSLKSIKNNVSKFVEENPVKDLQVSVKTLVTTAKKDLENIASKDINLLKKKFNDEKKQVEALINKTIPGQIKSAKKFIDDQKKEISRLQKKLETMVPSKKKIAKKVSKKSVSKKVVKKVAKK
jgi:F0F1-type ATP synthase membrane subunit b/b'